MRNRRFVLFALVLLLLSVVVYLKTDGQQTQQTQEPQKFETILIGKGSSPKWSPDGKRIAFISEDGWLIVVNADSIGLSKRVAETKGKGFDWLDSNSFITYQRVNIEEKPERKIFILGTLTMEGKESVIKADTSLLGEPPNFHGPYFLKDGTVGYFEGSSDEWNKGGIFKTIKKGKQKPEQIVKSEMKAFTKGDVWLRSIDGAYEKKITSGVYYRGAQLSPDGNKIMTKNSRGDILILNLEGKVLSSLGTGVYEGWTPENGTGEDQKWSPDGKQIVYALMVAGGEDGQFIVASDIYLVNWDGTHKIQLTNTPDEIEIEPTWSPDGTKIFCLSLDSNRIFIIKIK